MLSVASGAITTTVTTTVTPVVRMLASSNAARSPPVRRVRTRVSTPAPTTRYDSRLTGSAGVGNGTPVSTSSAIPMTSPTTQPLNPSSVTVQPRACAGRWAWTPRNPTTMATTAVTSYQIFSGTGSSGTTA